MANFTVGKLHLKFKNSKMQKMKIQHKHLVFNTSQLWQQIPTEK